MSTLSITGRCPRNAGDISNGSGVTTRYNQTTNRQTNKQTLLKVYREATLQSSCTFLTSLTYPGISNRCINFIEPPDIHCVSKKRPTLSFAVTLTNIDRFSKFFHWYILRKICNNAVTKYPTTPEQRRYTTLWNTIFKNYYNQNNYTRKKLFSETIFYYFNYFSSVIFSFRYLLGVYKQK